MAGSRFVEGIGTSSTFSLEVSFVCMKMLAKVNSDELAYKKEW